MANIIIDDEVIEKIRERLKATEFTSVEEYINYVLKQVIDKVGQTVSEEEEAQVKERLKSLGYFD